MRSLVLRFVNDQSAATAIEYGKIDPFGAFRRGKIYLFRQWLCPNQPLYPALLSTGAYGLNMPQRSQRAIDRTLKLTSAPPVAEIALPAWNGVKTEGLWVGVRRHAWGIGRIGALTPTFAI